MAHLSFHKRFSRGFTLIELLIVVAIIAIPLLAVGILLSGSSRVWRKIYEDTNSPIRQDATAVMVSLQNFGRQSNIVNYQVYKIENGAFLTAVPPFGQSVATGNAVEFRYWEETFNPSNPDADTLEVANTGTNYALYYLDGKELKVDFGSVVNGVGGVSDNSRQTANIISTQTLARDVDLSKTSRLFSHTVVGGKGNGCVNTNLTLTNTQGINIEIKFATMLRSAWPR